jgi:hypothetical protein
MTEYGERTGMKRYLADYDPNHCPPELVPRAAKAEEPEPPAA